MKPLFHLLISAAAFTLAPLRAETPPQPLELANLAAWAETGAWGLADEIQGSTQEKKWKSVKPGKAVLYNGAEGKTINLTSKANHSDAEVEVEFMIPKGSNSGIYLMSRYELQILDSYGKADNAITVHDGGAIYEQWDESKPEGAKGFGGTPPSTNASSAPGTWQTYKILFRAPRFDGDGKKVANARFIRVEHNGVVIHEDVEVPGPTRGGVDGAELSSAPLIVQGDHGPVAFRKLSVRPVKVD
ncbi:MAG: hypothetical protein B9S36_06365 [Verrucomicrobiia bacterium Tous-C2TDCM]|nr:MAG: hypothetical protein B9S36_06365 [Verrucomicrobiae bacterium Tous-C2TDCM]